MKSLPLFIGLRYTRAKSRNQFISIISVISIVGIMIGIMALIIVLSVMNGFHTEIKERILSMTSHITVNARFGGLQHWQTIAEKAEKNSDVIGTAPFIEGQAMLTHNGRMQAVLVRGILPKIEPKVSDVGQKMLAQSKLTDLVAGRYQIIIGKELARLLGVGLGDKITMLTPKVSITPMGSLPRMRRFTVTGIFEVGMGEYDRGVGFIHIKDAQKLFKLKNQVSGVRLKVKNMFNAPAIADQLDMEYEGLYRILDWTDSHVNFFAALAMEKRMMAFILFLIVIVASINIISTLVMVVIDKQSDIAILRSMGATSQMIRRIFIVQGATIGLIGSILGVGMGLLIALNLEAIVKWIEHIFHVQFINSNVFYISTLPSDVHFLDVFVIGMGAFIISLFATIYPAFRASKVEPAAALRYE